MLWKSGHAGVYIGGGYAIEAMGTSKGVVKTKVSDRNWQGWGKLPYIDYREEIDGKNDPSACDTLEIWHFTG